MKISLRARILIVLLTACEMLAGLWPAVGMSASKIVPSSAPGATETWLVSRGLLGSAMFGEQSRQDLIVPPYGVEVDETRQTESQTGQVLMQLKSWNEIVGDDTIHIEVTTLPSHQYEVAFWQFPNHRPGCAVFQWALYDGGRALQSRFWRNDTTSQLAGARNLPADLYPDAVPWMAFLRVLDAPREGNSGRLNQQITPYNYVGQEVSVNGTEQISVPAGSFSALKVTAQVDVATMMPNWPRFVLHIINPVVPKNTLYFQATAPYRLLKQMGPTFVGGPEVTTELVRFYTAAVERADPTTPAVETPAAPPGAALGGLPISK
ncbi:MAG: hypothetical protein ACLQUY_24645 [Ktedonobacterales bacterium]